MIDFDTILYQVSVWIIPVVTAITLHEAAHGWVAWRLGDDTARRMGRVTFNPFSHIDKIGTIILPAFLLLVKSPFLFGYAKPVPVNFDALGSPKRDMVLVAAAGPAMNIVMAFVAVLSAHLLVFVDGEARLWLLDNIENALLINVLLAVFNMLPLPPLDGGKVVTGLLPLPMAIKFARLERYGLALVFALFLLPPLIGREIGFDLNPVAWVLEPVMEVVFMILLQFAP